MATYRTFVRGREKYSLSEKKQLGELIGKASFHGAVLWTKLGRWRLPFKRFKVWGFTRGLCSESAGTATNYCLQESSKLIFLNRKHFWYLFKKVKNIWQHLLVFVFVSISKKSKENLFCMWKLCFLIFNNFPFQKFVKHVCRQILWQITKFWS